MQQEGLCPVRTLGLWDVTRWHSNMGSTACFTFLFRGAPVASWIVSDAVIRLRADIGSYKWHEWREAAVAMGIEVAIVRASPIPPACIVNDLIIVKWGFDPRRTAELVWHEIGHIYLHAGNREDWISMTDGALIMSKYERQADEFARAFPVWE